MCNSHWNEWDPPLYASKGWVWLIFPTEQKYELFLRCCFWSSQLDLDPAGTSTDLQSPSSTEVNRTNQKIYKKHLHTFSECLQDWRLGTFYASKTMHFHISLPMQIPLYLLATNELLVTTDYPVLPLVYGSCGHAIGLSLFFQEEVGGDGVLLPLVPWHWSHIFFLLILSIWGSLEDQQRDMKFQGQKGHVYTCILMWCDKLWCLSCQS